MAASTREVYLLLRARDEASRIIRGFSSELLRSASAAQAAALRAEATTRRQTASQLRAAGATREQVQAHLMAAQALENQARQLEINDQNARRLSQSLTAVAGALETTGIAFAVAGGFALKFFFDSAQLFAEYQRQVALTRTQVDGFTASMGEIGEVGLSVARRIPVAFEQIQPALFDIFSSTNANLAQSKILLEGFSKAAVAGQTDIQTAARGTISIMNAYNIPFEKVNEILDIQFELVRKGVGTYEEFANVFGRVVPAATRSQQSFATVAAMLAFMTRNGQSAAMASTAAARALELFTHPGAVRSLEQFGIKVRDVKGNFLPLIDILQQLRKELLKLPQAERVEKIVTLFKGSGFNIQARRFLEQVVLGAGELEDFAELLKSMGNASGVMQEKYSEMANTTAAKTQLLSNKWMAFRLAVGEAVTPALLILIDLLGRVVDWFNNLDPHTQNAIIKFGLFAAAGAVVIGVLLSILGLITGLVAAFMVASTEILITIGALAALIAIFGSLATAVVTAWQNSEGFRKLVGDLKDDTMQLVDVLVDFGKKVQRSFTYEMLPALQAFAQVVEEKVIPPFNKFRDEVWEKMRPRIMEALRIIHDIATAVFAAIGNMIENVVVPAIQKLSEWWEKNKAELMPLIDILIQVAKWLAIIVAALIAVGLISALATLVTIVLAAVTAFTFLVEVYKTTKVAIMAVVEAVKTAWNWLSDLSAKLRGIVSDAPSWLRDAGSNIIQGLIEGIKSKFNDLKNTVKGIAGTIANFFPHSPAKLGPLSGSGSPFKSGQTISNMLAAGMLDQLGIISAATNAVAGAASPFATATPADFASPVGLRTGNEGALMGTNNHVTVNVHTNEIDPRMTATELGWELAGRL